MPVPVGCAAERLEAVYGTGEDSGAEDIDGFVLFTRALVVIPMAVRLSDYVCCPVISG